MKKTITTFILLLAISVNSFACECSEYNLKELDIKSYEWSDLIIIANIKNEGTNYKIDVKEVLKGKITNDTIVGLTIGENIVFNNCTFYPRTKGEYLLYLKTVVIDSKTYYYSSECLGSRLLNLEYKPVALNTEKSKAELIDETILWISELQKRENDDLPLLVLKDLKKYKLKLNPIELKSQVM